VTASQNSCGTKVDTSSCGMVPALASSSEDEEDQKGDRETKETRRFGQCETQKRKGLHLTLRGRIASYRIDERGKHIADPDTGTDESDAGKAGPNHFGGSKIHF
jgi:hypothetical protein